MKKRILFFLFFIFLVIPISYSVEFGYNETLLGVPYYSYTNYNGVDFNITTSVGGMGYLRQHVQKGVLGLTSDYHFDNSSINQYCPNGNCSTYVLANNRYQYAYMYVEDLCGVYDDCYLTPDTVVNFTFCCYNFNSNYNNMDGYSGFYYQGEPVLIWEFKEGTDDDGNCKFSDFVSGDVVVTDHTLDDLCDYDSDCCIDYNYAKVDEFRLGYKNYYYGSKGWLDEIYLSNLSSTIYENDFPDVNFSVESTVVCYDDDLGYAQFNITLNVTDTDGDTIYYSLDEDVVNNYNFVWDFEKLENLLGFTLKGRDTSPLNYVVNRTGNCLVNSELMYYDPSKLNIIYNDNDDMDTLVQFDDGYGLELESSCYGSDKKVLFGIPYLIDNIVLQSSIYGLDQGENLTINLYDSSLDLIFNITLKGENSNLTIYLDDSLLYETDSDTDFFMLKISNSIYKEEPTIYDLYLDTHNYSIILADQDVGNSDRVFYIEYDYNELTSAVLSAIGIGGQLYSPVWVINEPDDSDFRIHTPDVTKMFTLYVTDSFHMNYSYWKSEYLLTSDGSEDCGIFEDSEIDLRVLSKAYLGNSLRFYLQDIGLYETGKSVLWVLWLFIFLGGLVGTILIKQFDVTLPLLTASGLCFIIAFLVDYSVHIVTHLTIFAIVLGPKLANIILGGR